MENEEVFEADVVHGLEQMHSHSPYRPTPKGHDTVKAPSANLESEREIHHEESPLLLPNRGDGGRETSEHGVSETRGSPKWNGEGDFEGRPWWNKPSVSNPRPRHEQYRLTNISRCSGSFPLTSSSP